MDLKVHTQLLTICGLIVGLFAPSLCIADTFNLSPFALYEQANKQIVIDGVSSQYALGVVGLALNANVTDNFELFAAAGYGLASNQKVSFAGANLIGDVSGTYTGLGAKFKIYDTNNGQNVKLEYQMHRRDLTAPTLTGIRNNSPLTGNSDITYNSNDFGISAEHTLSEKMNVHIAFGVSDWDFTANGTASTNSGITARKNIIASGSDPYWAVGLDWKLDKLQGEITIGQRNLSSQTKAKISHVKIEAQYSF
jgi:hypothetical protein